MKPFLTDIIAQSGVNFVIYFVYIVK